MESEAIRAQQVADLIASRVKIEASEASFLSPTSESLLLPAEAVANASGLIARGASSAATRVVGTAQSALDRIIRATNIFSKRLESRGKRRGGFQWTIQPSASTSFDELDEEEENVDDENDDRDFDGPDAISPSERIQSREQAAILKIANRMQRSALALALQWKDGYPAESAPSDATFLRVLQLVQDQILDFINEGRIEGDERE